MCGARHIVLMFYFRDMFHDIIVYLEIASKGLFKMFVSTNL